MDKIMKILHIVAGHSFNGGAARGAYWLHLGLLSEGIESKVLTNSVDYKNYINVESVLDSKKNILLNALHSKIDNFPLKFYKKKNHSLFSTSLSGFDIKKHPLYDWCDIIHLHWINSSFINIKHLSGIQKPIIWTLRDMWPLTGGCHTTIKCQKFKTGCGACPHLGSNNENDLSKKIIKRKEQYIPKHTKLVGITPWMSQIAAESYLYKDFDIETIYNNIICDDYFPIDKVEARKILGINTPKKILLYGAQYNSVPNKGSHKFYKALDYLDKDKYFILFFGRSDSNLDKLINFEHKNVGFLTDNISLRVLYSAADVFVNTSYIESFGKTIAESMSCGTPVVCFDTTGQQYIVDHKINGYKATAYDEKDLAKGINWIVDNSTPKMLLDARRKIIENFDNQLIAKQYINLYKKVLNKNYHNKI